VAEAGQSVVTASQSPARTERIEIRTDIKQLARKLPAICRPAAAGMTRRDVIKRRPTIFMPRTMVKAVKTVRRASSWPVFKPDARADSGEKVKKRS